MPTVEELLAAIRERRVVGPRRPTWQLLHKLADDAAPEIRAAFLRAVAQTQGAARIEQIETALKMGNLAAADQAIPWDDVAVKSLNATLPRRLRDLVIAAGIAAERMQPAGLNFSFHARNPLAIKAAAEQAANLVTEISGTTRDAIRQSITRAIDEGRTPAQAAREIRDMIGLNSRQESGLATLRAQLEDSGRPEVWIDRRMARETRQALNDRATTIAFHETMTAANAGQQALWEQARDAGLIQGQTRREYVVTPDDSLCPVCRPLDGNTYGLTEPIVTELGSVLSPPIHVNCLPGNALVTPGDRIAAVTERWYDGELLTIHLARRKQISCTPNHPILTTFGWVPAWRIREIGHVICCARGSKGAIPIKTISDTYRRSWDSCEMPVTAEDFHGDGEGSNWSLVRFHSALAATPRAESRVLRQEDLGIETQRGDVVRVDAQGFRGLIFNLDCGGWYASNGIITGNCRCTMVLSHT